MTTASLGMRLKEIGSKPFRAEKLRYRLFWFLLIAFVLVSYAMRGLTAPWSYGYFNYTFNWLEGGYIAKGFFGTVIQLIVGKDLAYSDAFLAALQYIFAWAMIIYLVYVCYRLILKHGNLFCGILLLIYSTSTFNMFYMAEIGFTDHVAFCLVAAAMEICIHCKPRTCIIWCAVLSSISVITLSTAAFSCCPIIASLALLKTVHAEKKLSVKRFFTIALAFIPTVVLAGVFSFMPSSETAWNNYMAEISKHAYYDQYWDNYLTYCWFTPASANFEKTWLYFEPAVFMYSAVFIALTVYFLIFAADEGKSTVIWFAVLAAACCFVGYAEIYFATDSHRYYFDAVFSVVMLAIFMMRLNEDKYMNVGRSLGAAIVSAACLAPFFKYRLWIWNRVYNDFWFMSFFK